MSTRGIDYSKWDNIEEEKKARREEKVRAVPENSSSRKAARPDAVGKGENGRFVNHGLRRWEEGRAKWLEVSPNRQRPRRHPPVDDELIYDTIFSKPMGWLLPHPVPLAHMVELLEDEWSD